MKYSNSTCISSFTYDEKTQQLDITFVKRGSHSYSDVPKKVAKAFANAGSKGQFFNSKIRNSY